MKIALIMAGGNGSRFWPLSRKKRPKQLLKLNSKKKSLIEQTFERINSFIPKEQIFIATNKNYKSIIKEKIDCLADENILIEEISRNTAPAITLALLKIEKKFPNSTIFIIPSDHLIEGEKEFEKLLLDSADLAEKKEKIFIIGVKPGYAETGYGYISFGKKKIFYKGFSYKEVKEFKEKPDKETAETYLQKANYYWNTGIYIVPAQKLINEIKLKLPDTYKKCCEIIEINDYREITAIEDKSKKRIVTSLYESLEDIAIEYAVIEKMNDIYVVEANFRWDDLGSWTSLERVKKKNDDQNIIVGKHIGIDTKDSIIYSCNRIVTTVGVKNLIIVNTGDAVLICDKNKAQEIKELQKLLESENFNEYL